MAQVVSVLHGTLAENVTLEFGRFSRSLLAFFRLLIIALALTVRPDWRLDAVLL
jgi:hypothetical protein